MSILNPYFILGADKNDERLTSSEKFHKITTGGDDYPPTCEITSPAVTAEAAAAPTMSKTKTTKLRSWLRTVGLLFEVELVISYLPKLLNPCALVDVHYNTKLF